MEDPKTHVRPKATLRTIALAKIDEGDRWREDYGDLSSLVESIKEHGLIQPITVERDSLRLITGGRRFRACKEAGLLEIPVLTRVLEGDLDLRRLELAENLCRKDFTWAEECTLLEEIDKLERADRKGNWSIRDTANLVEESKSNVARKLELAKALRVLPELANCATESDARKMYNKALEQAMTAELRSRQTAAIEKSDAADAAGAVRADGVAHEPDPMTQFLKRAIGNYSIGDTLVELEGLRDNGMVNYINCDPPYGVDLDVVKNQEGARPESYQEIRKNAFPEFLAKLCALLYKKAGRDCWMTFWYGQSHHQLVLTSLRAAGWDVDEIPCIWSRGSGQTLQPEVYLARTYETFFMCRKGQPALLKRGRPNVFDVPPVPAARKYHPTEKPIALSMQLLEAFCPIRGTLLVPFLGSGVDLRAGYLHGAMCFGYDIDPQYKDRFLLAVEQDMKDLDKE